jgi:hypothetical protein
MDGVFRIGYVDVDWNHVTCDGAKRGLLRAR